jgi:hypothetical protein
VSFTADTGATPQARLARAARAADELCGVLWEALHWELAERDQPGDQRGAEVVSLAERLAQVCSAVADIASCVGELPDPAHEPSAHEPPARESSASEPSVHEPPARESSASEPSVHEPSARESPAPEPSVHEPPAPEPPAPQWDPSPAPEIEIHDARGEEPREPPIPAAGTEGDGGPIAWAEAIGRSIERYTVDALPFAVLLVEVAGVERLTQAESQVALESLVDPVERTIRAELRPPDGVARESPGRWWVTASRTDARGAHTIAERLACTARTVASRHGVPLELVIGVAVCPADGRDSATLAAHADVALYAARAAGQPVAPVDDAA